jgi:hypothetical protein
MSHDDRTHETVIANWSPQQRADAARNLMAFISILREWDSSERMSRAQRMLESASSEE